MAKKQEGYFWCETIGSEHSNAKSAIRAGEESGKKWLVNWYKSKLSKPVFIAKGRPIAPAAAKRKKKRASEDDRAEKRRNKRQERNSTTGNMSRYEFNDRRRKNNKWRKKKKKPNKRAKAISPWWRDVLKEVGFESYSTGPNCYLRSRLWAGIKKAALDEHGRFCKACKRSTKTIHHMAYSASILRGDDLSVLVPICKRCHDLMHHGGKGKRTLAEANQKLEELIETKGPEKKQWDKSRKARAAAKSQKRQCAGNLDRPMVK